MKRSRPVPLLLFGSILGVVCPAQSLPAQAPAHGIVTVSFNAAVLRTAEAQRELSTLQTRFAPRQAQLQALSDEVETLRKQLSEPGDKMNDADRETRGQSLEKKEKQLQRQTEDFKNDSEVESQQLFQRVARKVYAFLQTYSQQHGYSVVIERGSDAAPVVWYAANQMDITDQLIAAYNLQSDTVTGSAKPTETLPSGPLSHQ